MTSFRPGPGTVGGHRQTLLGYFFRRRLRWTLPAEDLVVEAGPDVSLLLRASWQPGPRQDRPALLLVHGLGGADAAGYVVATGALAWQRGWHVLRMNMRGAGDGARVCARLYNAGLEGDLLAVLERMAGQVSRLAVVGFSLGGNLALLALALGGSRLPRALSAAAAVSAPLDLAACADALELPANLPYQWYFMRNLRRVYRERQAARPDLYALGRERAPRTVREYDDAITAPYGGHASAAEYYARSSSGPLLPAIQRPTLVLAAADDPMVPVESVTRWPLPASGCVRVEVTPSGGHVGFVAPCAALGRFWAAERVVHFLSGGILPGTTC